MRGCLFLLNSISPTHKTPHKTPCVASSIFQLSALPRTDLPRFRCHGMPQCAAAHGPSSLSVPWDATVQRTTVGLVQNEPFGCGRYSDDTTAMWPWQDLALRTTTRDCEGFKTSNALMSAEALNLKPHISATNQPIPFGWNTSDRAHPFALGICFFSSPRLALADENGEQLLPEAHHLLKISSAEWNQAGWLVLAGDHALSLGLVLDSSSCNPCHSLRSLHSVHWK